VPGGTGRKRKKEKEAAIQPGAVFNDWGGVVQARVEKREGYYFGFESTGKTKGAPKDADVSAEINDANVCQEH